MPLGPCSGFKAKHCNFYSFSFLFLFLLFFFFFSFSPFSFSTGVLNLLKAVNETRVGYAN